MFILTQRKDKKVVMNLTKTCISYKIIVFMIIVFRKKNQCEVG